jgi:hypothetical protein
MRIYGILVNHFNKEKHSLNNLNFFIFRDKNEDSDLRLNLELQLIHLFLSLEIPILNEKKPSILCHKKFFAIFDN